MTPDLAWAAGLFEGEGCVRVNHRADKRNPKRHLYHGLTLSIGMCDREPLDTFAEAAGVGKVMGPYGPYGKPHHSPFFSYALHGKVAARVMEGLLPWLSQRRRQQYTDVLSELVGLGVDVQSWLHEGDE